MKHRFAVLALVVLAIAAFGATQALAATGRAAQASKKSKKKPKSKIFEVCLHGCKFRTIQKAVDAAGSFKAKKKNAKIKAVVKVKPGKYVEGVVIDGTKKKKDFDGLTIMGTKNDPKQDDPRRQERQGRTRPGAERHRGDQRQRASCCKNMWARNYESNGFFVHADDRQRPELQRLHDGQPAGLRQPLLRALRQGLLRRQDDQLGRLPPGRLRLLRRRNARATRPTSPSTASNRAPVRRRRSGRLLKNDESYENVLGYSGTNSKYVRITESDFFNNGAGIVPNTLDSEGYEPNGWNVFEKNNVFWNNYNYFLAASSFKTVSAGSAKSAARRSTTRPGVGIVLYGGDGNVVKQNNVFGNYKWGVASFSGPGEIFVANEGDDAKNVNNQILENSMGRDGTDPNGEYDFWNDATGGGNCWGGNTAGVDASRPATAHVPLAEDLPGLPAGAGRIRPGQQPQPRRRPAAQPGQRIATRKRSSATPARPRRRTSSAPGCAGRRTPGVRKIQARSRSPRRPAK